MVNIGPVSYAVLNNPLALFPPSVNGGGTSVRAIMTDNTARVPEPATKDKFGRPTDVPWDAYGNIFISDGYINSRVVKSDGTAASPPRPATRYNHFAVGRARMWRRRVSTALSRTSNA